MNAPRTILAALFASLAVACSPDSGSSPSSSGGTGFGSAAAVDMSKQVAFEAVRRYTSFSGAAPTSYTERFVRAEDGRTKVELLELNGKPLSSLSTQAEIDAFLTMQKLLEGGAGRYAAVGRDFAIRDFDPFLQNYSYALLQQTASVAGQPCVVAEVRSDHPDRPNYWVWIDAERFTTLKYVERLPGGAVVAEMECLKVDYAFNAKNEVFPASAASKPFDASSAALESLVPFTVFEPAYVPAGFVLESVRFATIASRPVLSWIYTDGVQEISIAQYTEIGTPELAPPASYPPDSPVHVRVTVLGAVVSTTFVIDGTQIHVKAKVEPDELMSIVESLVPIGG